MGMQVAQRAAVRVLCFTLFFINIANAAQHNANTPARKAGSHLSAVLPPVQQRVQALIVTPHGSRGRKLSAELASRNASKLSQLANVSLLFGRSLSGRSHLIKLQQAVSLAEAQAIAARLRTSSEVESAEPDLIMNIDAVTPADPGYAAAPGQWNYMTPDTLNAGGADLPDAWSKTLGSGSINVAVLDTGYLPHADLGLMLPGHDFVTSTPFANDGSARDNDAHDPGDWVVAGECGSGMPAANSSWHGTHVAGIIAALMNNGLDGTGIAPNVRLLPVRALGKCGGYTSDIVDAMRWAAGIDVPGAPHNQNPARVINLSLGSAGHCSAAFQSAVNDVNAVGAIVVVASGNGGFDAVSQPANCSGVIAVTAHVLDGDNADYANIGPETSISAPGGGCGTASTDCTVGSNDGLVIYSLSNSGTTTPVADSIALKRGTSMAAPHVSGTIALMLSLDPGLSRAQVTTILRASARPHPLNSICGLTANTGMCGAGLLDAQAALSAIVPTVQMNQPQQIAAPNTTVNLIAGTQLPTGRSLISTQWLASPSNRQAVSLTNADSLHASFVAPASGTYLFTLNVTDSSGAVGSATAIVKVNSPPLLLAAPASAVDAGASLQLQLQATDVDGDLPVFHALSLPAGASLSASGVFSWPSATPVGNYQIAYYASDSNVDSATAVMSVAVLPGAGATASFAGGGAGGGGSMDSAWMIAGGALIALLRRIRRSRRI